MDFDRGILGEKEFFKVIKEEMNLPLSMEEFMGLWNEIFTEKKAMVNWSKSLKGKYKIGILSNTNPWHLKHLKKNHGWLFEFDAFVGSCEVQMMKPDPRIYKYILEKLSAAPKETFYVDDIAENVAAAKNIGMDAVQFKDEESFFEEVKKRNF